MADELEDLCGRISLTKKEKVGIKVEEGDVLEVREVVGKCLMGKVWAEKNINKEAFKTVLANIWCTVGGVKFKELCDNIWLFEFTNDADKKRVMEGRPWTFNRQILVLNEYNGNIPPSQLEFNQFPF